MPKIGPVPVSDNSRSKWVGLSQETVRWFQECLHSVQKRIPLACLQFNGLGKCVQYTSNICLYAQLHGICIKTYLRMYWSASVSRMHVVYTHPVCKLLSACGVTFRHVQRRACIYSIYGMALSFFLLSSFLPFFLYSFLLSFYSSLCHVSFLSYHCIYLSVWLSLSIYRSISWWDINGFHHFCKNCENIYIYPEQSWMLPLQPFWKASVLRSAWLFFDRVLHQTTTNLGDLQKFTEFHIFLTCSVCSFAILTM